MNLAEGYNLLCLKEREIIVKVWNSRRKDKLSIATLPFADAWTIKRVVYDFYEGIADDQTVLFPRGVSFKELLDYEAHIKRVLAHVTRKPIIAENSSN